MNLLMSADLDASSRNYSVQQYRRIGLYGTVILLLRAWWQCRNRSSGWAITARPPPRPAGGSGTNPAGGGAEVAPMPRPAREIGGTTTATPAVMPLLREHLEPRAGLK